MTEPPRGLWLRALDAAARLPWLLWVVVGLLLAAPSLTTGFVADDHYHHIVGRQDIEVPSLEVGTWNLFTFADGDVARMHAGQEQGIFPWWAQPDLKLSFWRPLSAATHQLDYALWPDNALLQHAHSLMWLGLLFGLAAVLYRRMDAGGSRGALASVTLATLIYVLDDAHGPTFGWIANRNALIAGVLSLAALLVHDRWRRDAWWPGAWLGPLAVALGLLAGEATIAVGAYLFAYALWLDEGTPWERVRSLLPYLVVVVAWRVAYSALGYGTHGSWLYIDPASDPVAFLKVAVVRVPALLNAAVGGPWSDFLPMIPAGARLQVTVFNLACLAVLGWLSSATLREDPHARFFATGAVLAAVPVAATVPADRLLTMVTVGTAGLLGLVIARALEAPRRVVRWAGGGLLVVNVALAAPLLVVRAQTMQTVADFVGKADASWPALEGVETLVFINPPMDPAVAYVQLERLAEGRPIAPHTRWLATGNAETTVVRIDAHTLEVSQPDGLLTSPTEALLWGEPFHVGDTVTLSDVSVEVLAVDGPRPQRVRYRFTEDLDSPGFVFLAWGSEGFEPFGLPPIGEQAVLPAIDVVALLLDP